ncbi:MAG: hypothetical protein IPI67_32845 [Myxococcales bacterium]|nr:hypothetical protein [Myxococcales bacterium]
MLWSQSSPKRDECHRLMLEAAAEFACRYCPEPINQEQCSVFRRVAASESARIESCRP